jgi:hypothetical protein
VALMTIALSSLGVPLPGVRGAGRRAGHHGTRALPASNVLRSGWLLGENAVANHSTVVDAEVGSGDVVLLGMSVQHRAEAHGTYKLLFNSVYLAGEK